MVDQFTCLLSTNMPNHTLCINIVCVCFAVGLSLLPQEEALAYVKDFDSVKAAFGSTLLVRAHSINVYMS